MLNKKENILDEFDEEEIQLDKAPNKGKRMVFILIPLIIAIIGAVAYAAFYFLNGGEKEVSKEISKVESAAASHAPEFSFVEMDDMIVTIMSSSTKKNFLKISLSLQIKDKQTSEVITEKLPIIQDSFQVFLRELRPADLSGSAGILMLKTELLKRINKIVAPEVVMDVLFKEILLS